VASVSAAASPRHASNVIPAQACIVQKVGQHAAPRAPLRDPVLRRLQFFIFLGYLPQTANIINTKVSDIMNVRPAICDSYLSNQPDKKLNSMGGIPHNIVLFPSDRIIA